MTYHEDTSRISKSGLDLINKSPLHYWHRYLNPDRETETTPALEFGSAFHLALTEPDKYAARYAVFNGDRRTNAGKQAYQELLDAGMHVIKKDDADTISKMREAVMRYPRLVEALEHGKHEQTYLWTDSTTGAPCKMRLDTLHNNVVFDWKTTEDASPAAFRYSIRKYRYHVQNAFYLHGLAANDIHIDAFYFVAIEKSAPHGVGIYELPVEAINEGMHAYEANLKTYMQCRITNKWNGYQPQLIEW
jgi:exodeoxyribonuclease VIII